MGLRGPPPKPTKIRVLEGVRGHHRPIGNEPEYRSGLPDRPPGMTAGARRIWNVLVGEMAASGVLRPVDAMALAQLCEDQYTLNELRKGMNAMVQEIAAKAREKKLELPGGPMVQLSRTIEGRRTLSTIRELSFAVIVQRREFGLTPASNSRVQAAGGPGFESMDILERAIG